jgi:hypothetical protein
MNETIRTAIFIGVAVALGCVAWFVRPTQPQPEQFSDVGEPFYPEFTDPRDATSLEVIEYDEASGTARPFKVQVVDGVWSIPSHYDYPADGEDRLASTAAAMIDLTKDTVQSDRAQDHEALGVIDPFDETETTLKGRGKRVTLRDKSGSVLADYIFGKAVPDRDHFRYVRLPGKKRTYAVNVDVDLSTRFADWIETNLLDVQRRDVARLTINDYSVDETTGRVEQRGVVELTKQDNAWTMPGAPADRELDTTKVNQMLSALTGLTITGVRPKPESMSSDLRTKDGLTIDLPTRLSLQSKGFFIGSDGSLVSNEGEVTVGTNDGVRYVLRFGEVLYGEGLGVSAGIDEDAEPSAEDEQAGPSAGVENRYLFVTAEFDESLLPPKPEPPAAEDEGEGPPADDASDEGAEETSGDHDAVTGDEGDQGANAAREAYERELAAWEAKVQAGRDRVSELNDRFAEWYYVISATDYDKIRLDREALLKPIETEAGGEGG